MPTRLHALRDNYIRARRDRLARLRDGDHIRKPADAFLLHPIDDCRRIDDHDRRHDRRPNLEHCVALLGKIDWPYVSRLRRDNGPPLAKELADPCLVSKVPFWRRVWN